QGHRDAELLEVARTLNPGCSGLCPPERGGQKHASQNANHRDDHEQFYQGKSMRPRPRTSFKRRLFHKTLVLPSALSQYRNEFWRCVNSKSPAWRRSPIGFGLRMLFNSTVFLQFFAAFLLLY